MQPTLIIVESPNKTKKIEDMFPGRFKAMATYGHVCDLPSNPATGIGIDRGSMTGQYQLTQDSKRRVDGKRIIANLQRYLKDHPGTEIYLGTDEDREGESIAGFVMKYLRLKNPKRMRFNAITKEKIEQAYQRADHIDWNAVASREARRLIDRIIGYTASPYLFQKINQRGVAAGRVQTAVEALVIERERKIRNHQAQTYYTVAFDLGGWTAQWQIPASVSKRSGPKQNAEYDIDDTSQRCLDEAVARQIASYKTLLVDACTQTQESRLPPSPLYTISMIQVANRVLGWDAEQTMQVAQKLFEGDGSGHGHITYHRTDSPNIDPLAAEAIRTWLRQQGHPVPVKPNTWVCKNKQAQEGHEAIRPAYFEVEDAGANDEQRLLYRLIRERAIYSQLAPAHYAVKSITLTDAAKGTDKFTATARTITDAGWLKTPSAKSITMQDDGAEEVAPTVTLPNLQRGTMVTVRGTSVNAHTSKAPPRYTMNTLTAKLEKLSIGRPATMATLLKNVQTKGTILLRKDKKLEATALAEKCYDALYPRFAFASIGYTAELEEALDQIANGQLDGQVLARTVWDRLDADCSAAMR
jgi:DNA topoisomerase I